jgi:hypothetical protein
MNKGVTIKQAAQACHNFSEAGIMVHAYLMYGFPTQTAQETIDALEIVRQFFHEGLIQSAFWHQFTATVHSDVGRNPEKYRCAVIGRPAGTFARNDLEHEDPTGCDHRAYAPGLKKAVYNFMHGLGTDLPVKSWFDHKVPAISVKRNYVQQAINHKPADDGKMMGSRMVWIENPPHDLQGESTKKDNSSREGKFVYYSRTETFTLLTTVGLGVWLNTVLNRSSPQDSKFMTLEELKQEYEKQFSPAFGTFLRSSEWKTLREKGLLLI